MWISLRRGLFWAALVLMLGGLAAGVATAQTDLPQGLFTEDFRTFAFADGARTTAWWDRSGQRLTLRPPDARPLRGHPQVVGGPAGGMVVVWTEARDGAPRLWMQQVDGHGNRLWDEDVPLFAWAGERWSSGIEDRAVALSALTDERLLLVWSDDQGVWAYRHDAAQSTVDPAQLRHLAGASNAIVHARCAQRLCVVGWQTPVGSEWRSFDEEMNQVGSRQESGTGWAAVSRSGRPWLMRQDAGSWLAQPLTSSLADDGASSEVLALPDEEILDVAAGEDGVWLLSAHPTRLWRLAPAGAPQVVATYEDAATGRLLAMADGVLVLLQTAGDASLWLYGPQPATAPRLLRLGLPGYEVHLAAAGRTSDGAVAVLWQEAGQLLARRWLPGGWSSWRHEISPAYVATAGPAANEGLGHSLAVNAPWQAVTAVRLDADMVLNGGSVQFYVSNQGPRAWQAIVPGGELVFPTPGTELRWYVRLRRAAAGPPPELRSLTLRYQYKTLLYWPLALNSMVGH